MVIIIFDLRGIFTEVKIFLPPLKRNCSQLNNHACGGCSSMFMRRVLPFTLNALKKFVSQITLKELEALYTDKVEGEIRSIIFYFDWKFIAEK